MNNFSAFLRSTVQILRPALVIARRFVYNFCVEKTSERVINVVTRYDEIVGQLIDIAINERRPDRLFPRYEPFSFIDRQLTSNPSNRSNSIFETRYRIIGRLKQRHRLVDWTHTCYRARNIVLHESRVFRIVRAIFRVSVTGQ